MKILHINVILWCAACYVSHILFRISFTSAYSDSATLMKQLFSCVCIRGLPVWKINYRCVKYLLITKLFKFYNVKYFLTEKLKHKTKWFFETNNVPEPRIEPETFPPAAGRSTIWAISTRIVDWHILILNVLSFHPILHIT